MTDDAERWHDLARVKGPARAAWDSDHDETDEHLAEILPYMPEFGTILDLGCGPGRLAYPAARRMPGCTIIGFDVSLAMVMGKPTNLLPNLRYEVDASGHLPNERFDGGYSMLTFQHLHEDTVRTYIEVLHGRFEVGAPFRLQAVVGPADHYDWDVDDWQDAFADGGWSVKDVKVESDRPWIWLTARPR